MAKIKRLFPHWNIPAPDDVEGDSLKAAVDSADALSKEVPGLQAILPFDEETQKVEMPQQLKNLLRFMFVLDPIKRPSAKTMLASRELQEYEDLVSG